MSKTSLVGKNDWHCQILRYLRDSGNNMNKLRDSGIYEKLVRDSGSRPPLPDPEIRQGPNSWPRNLSVRRLTNSSSGDDTRAVKSSADDWRVLVKEKLERSCLLGRRTYHHRI